MTNYYLGAILLMLIAIYTQGEMREAAEGRQKSIVGGICSMAVPIVLVVGIITH